MTKPGEKLSAFNQRFSGLAGKLQIKNNFARRLLTLFLFVLALNWFYSYTGVYRFLPKRPASIHFSAQTSRACVALNYYENKMNFFTPQYQRSLEGKGYTGLEFPIIYYLGALMYKMFGFHEIFIRILSLLFFTAGIYFFYLLVCRFTRSSLVSITLSLVLISSPVIVFYAPNFMPDPPALGLALIAWYYFFKYLEERKRRQLHLFYLFITLATLLKITAGIALVIIVCLVLLDRLKFFRSNGRDFIFNEKRRMIILTFVSWLVVFAWYAWSAWFTKSHGGETFLMNTMMLNDWEGFLYVIDHMKKLWLNHYYSVEFYTLLAVCTAFILIGIRYLNRLLFTITILYTLGSLAYFYLFMYQFVFHDYYVIMMLPSLFFLLLCFADLFSRFSRRYFYPAYLIFFFIMFFNLKESLMKTKDILAGRYDSSFYYWTGDFRAYEDMEPKLRKLGIKREDRVISAYDFSDCGTLYLANQLGVTIGPETRQHVVDSFIQHPNTHYLLLSDSAKFRQDFHYDFSDKMIGVHRGVIIYRIK